MIYQKILIGELKGQSHWSETKVSQILENYLTNHANLVMLWLLLQQLIHITKFTTRNQSYLHLNKSLIVLTGKNLISNMAAQVAMEALYVIL
jgi:hypothetical protein